MIRRPYLKREIRKDRKLDHYSKEEIDHFYNLLKQYSNVDEQTKQKHISVIQNKYS